MNHISILSPLVLASLLVAPISHAETYGQSVQDEPDRPGQIKTVPRPAPAIAPSVPTRSACVAGAPCTDSSAVATFPVVEPKAEPAPVTAATDNTPQPIITSQESWRVATADRFVRVSLARWAKEADFQLVWDVNRDIEISVDTTFSGSFEEAMHAVMQSIAQSDYPLEAVIYPNRVVRIVKLARKD